MLMAELLQCAVQPHLTRKCSLGGGSRTGDGLGCKDVASKRCHGALHVTRASLVARETHVSLSCMLSAAQNQVAASPVPPHFHCTVGETHGRSFQAGAAACACSESLQQAQKLLQRPASKSSTWQGKSWPQALDMTADIIL